MVTKILNEALDGLVWEILLTYAGDIVIVDQTKKDRLETFEKNAKAITGLWINSTINKYWILPEG